MRVSFVFPSAGTQTGGVVLLYRLANGLADRGHDVHFFHGPAWEGRVDDISDLPEQAFGSGVRHRIVDTLDDPALPAADVIFDGLLDAPATLGHPATVMQGYRILAAESEDQLFRRPGPTFCVARWLLGVGESLGVDPHQLRYVPPGLDHDLFSMPRADPDRPIDISMLYNPMPAKGWPDAAEALEEIVRARPDLRVVVFGRNVEPPELPVSVEYVDGADHETLAREVYGRTRVFVQTSIFEGFGLTCIEAMGCGAALVTTACGGSSEYAIADQTAVVVPRQQPQAVVKATLDLLADEPRRRRLAQAGEQHIRRFRWDRSVVMLETGLREYVDDPAAFSRPPRDP